MKLDKKPIVISFLQEKGGAGKTTISTNFARGLSLKSYNTLLFDSDPQGSLRDWHVAGQGLVMPVLALDRESLPTSLKSIRDDFDFVVIDGARGQSNVVDGQLVLSKMTSAVILASDFIIIPVQPSPYDIWATSPLVESIKYRQALNPKLKAIVLISRAIKNTKLCDDAFKALQELDLPVFDSFTTQTVAYPSSAAEGKTVFDIGKNVAATQMEQIVDEFITRFLNGS